MNKVNIDKQKKIRELCVYGVRVSGGEIFRDAIKKWDSSETIDLSGLDLRNLNFSRMNLPSINFDKADLRGANFKKTNAFKCSFEKADLRGANLDDFDVDEFKLWGADVKGAHISLECYPVERLLDMELDSNQLKELGKIIDKQRDTLKKKLEGKTVEELFKEECGVKINMAM